MWLTECISDVFGNTAGKQAGEAPLDAVSGGLRAPDGFTQAAAWQFISQQHVRCVAVDVFFFFFLGKSVCICQSVYSPAVCVHVQRHCECHC